ncbi:cilia- and flagella-associated protein 68 isoform X3 [Narcine bancroftii]|uniref:cilia- and flagella-associated protein 68 isoform X3 n=1 Tax=Narcine bancroftii TaxID=1343680 RepID=UPI003831F94C
MEVAEEAMGNVLRLCTTAYYWNAEGKQKNCRCWNLEQANNCWRNIAGQTASTGTNRERVNQKRTIQAHEDTPAYDEVTPEVPVYAVVNKKKPEDVHYAELQMIQQGTRRTIKQVKARQKENATEYATISFTPVVKYDRKNGTLV